MLRNRTVLIALAVVLLLGMRFIPLQQGPGSGDPSGGPSSGSPAQVAPRGGSQARPTAQPAVVDPSRLQGQSNPFLVLRAATVRRGAPLVIAGQFFEPYQELVVSLRGEGDALEMELGTAWSDKNGYLPDISLPLPEGLKPGRYTVVATPALGGPSVEASLRVDSGQTWATLTGTSAKPKESVGFEGGGFMPQETVFLHLDSLATPALATTSASPEGDVSGAFRLPLADEGDHLILFYGEQSRMPAMVDFNIQGFHPWVVLDNYSPSPEQSIGFAGSDFAPGESVYVFLNSLESGPASVVQVDRDGSFQAGGALPLGPEVIGEQKLLFVGDQSQMAAEAEFTVLPYPAALQLAIYSGPPGSEVAFVGTGFARGEEVRAYMGEPGTGREVSSFHADEKGNFAAAGGFRVPRNTEAGDHTLSVVGQVSGAEASAAFTVIPISAWAEVNPDEAGRPTVVGRGFAPGESVELMVGQLGGEPIATAEADEGGNAQFAALEVAVEGPGPLEIRLKGRESGGEARAEFYGGPQPESAGEPGSEERGSLEFEPAGE